MDVTSHLGYCPIIEIANLGDIDSYYFQQMKPSYRDLRKAFAEYILFELPPTRSEFRHFKHRWWMFNAVSEARRNYRKLRRAGIDIKPFVFQAFGKPQSAPTVQHLDLGELRIVNCSKRSIAVCGPGYGLRSSILPSGELERESFRALWTGGNLPKTTVFLFPESLDLGISRNGSTGALRHLSYHSPADRLLRNAISDGAKADCRLEFRNLTPKQLWHTGEYLAVRVADDDGYNWVDFP